MKKISKPKLKIKSIKKQETLINNIQTIVSKKTVEKIDVPVVHKLKQL